MESRHPPHLPPLVAAITHELRTPLQAIIGFGQLALMDWPQGVDRRYLTHIDQASRLMLRVVNDLLDLSHLENGTLEIEHDQPLDVHALLLEVLDTADSLRMDKALALHVDVDAACPRHLRGDGKRIAQVLLNLVSNAVRFTDQGQVVLGVRLLGRRDGEVRLRLSVADTGLGLPPERLARMAQPAGALPPQRGGSGFGLQIVHRLLALHGTELKAASVEGGGTLVWFDLSLVGGDAPASDTTPDALVLTNDRRLFHTVRTQWAAHDRSVRMASSPQTAPCAASRWVIDASQPEAQAWLARARALGCQAWLVSALPVPPQAPPAQGLSLPQLPQAAFGAKVAQPQARDPALVGMRVLVVEDSRLNQHVIREHLHRLGVECTIADSGQRAQACLMADGEGAWDAALLDMQLPDMSGLQLARWMRAQAHCAKLPFVFLSAHLSTDDRLAAEVLGAQGCLLKPHDPQALQKLLLSMRHPLHPAQSAPPPGTSATSAGKGLAGHAPPLPARTQAGLLALSRLDVRQLMRSEWPGLRLGLQRAQDPADLRKAVHAVRGALAMLGDSPSLQEARRLEEALLAGSTPDADTLRHFMSLIEDMLALSSPHPG